MSFQKTKPLRDRAYLDSYRDAACIRCGVRDGTVVGAHLNWGGAGGMGMKGPDSQTLPFCHRCHVEHDSGKGGRYGFWLEAFRQDPHLLREAVNALAAERYRKWAGMSEQRTTEGEAT